MSPHHKARAAAGRIGGLTRAAREANPRAAAQRGQRGLMARFEKQIPAEITCPKQRAERAELLLKAHMNRLSAAATKKRQAKRAA